MSQALRKLAGTLNRTDTICLFTNQLREKIGVMFGSPETTSGGRALKFYASVRLDIRRIETLKDGAEAYGNRVRVKVVKNKVAPPFKQAEFDVIYGSGISWEGTVLDVGIERKVVQKAGSYFSFGDERLGQGRQNATAFLGEHPDLVQQILARIQAEAPTEQVVSARLLPQAEGATNVEVTPIEDEEVIAESVPVESCESREKWGRDRRCRRLRPTRRLVDGVVDAAATPVITRLRARGAGRVEVELDGRPWRVVPAEAVLVAGLAVGRALDRATARTVGRELRRLEARGQALRALRARDHTVASLDRRLAERGAAPRVRRETVAAVQRAGLVDDGRLARERATLLADRGAGDGMIAADLEHRGVPDEEIHAALASARVRGGRGPRGSSSIAGARAGTARHLASKGFSEEAIETLIADLSSDAVE